MVMKQLKRSTLTINELAGKVDEKDFEQRRKVAMHKGCWLPFYLRGDNWYNCL